MAPAIPKGSLILITGVNGYLGSNVADQFLEAGYRVRGTTRDLKKAEGLKNFWEKKHGSGRLELVVVKDMSKEGAFGEAVKVPRSHSNKTLLNSRPGVDGVAHTASNMTFDSNLNKVISEVLAGVNGILKSAASEPSVKRFVYTSSSTAPNRIKNLVLLRTFRTKTISRKHRLLHYIAMKVNGRYMDLTYKTICK